MKDILKHFVIGLVIGLIASGLMVWGYNVGKRHSTNTVDTIIDTIQINDTITNLQYDTVYFNRYDTINTTDVVIINDTVNDTTYIQLPIYTYIFDTLIQKEDYQTHLKATVTGFNSTLDEVLLETTVFKKEPVIQQEKWYQRFGIGVGVMVGTGGVGVGCGIMYKL